MIKVTVKENVMDKDGRVEIKLKEKSHEKGEYASVHNGVLTVFDSSIPKVGLECAIAGYEPSAWMSWEKVDNK